jgi:phage tail-like protein
MSEQDRLAPLHVFRFQVDFREDRISTNAGGSSAGTHGTLALCSGAFSECTGLEATMEPKVIREGGRNYGAIQRSGPVTFATVILKRGMTRTRDLWHWFELVTNGSAYAFRMTAIVTLKDEADEPVLAWRLERALPVRFRSADLNARGAEVGIEELHLAHEGLRLIYPEAQRR